MLRGLIYLIALLFGGLLLAVIIGIFTREPLNSQVAEIIEHSLDIDKQAMQQNAYVSFMGIHAPEEMDYFLIGKQIILDSQQKDKAVISSDTMQQANGQWSYYNTDEALELDYRVAGKDYQFPCKNLTDFFCTQKINDQAEEIAQLLQKNHILLERYKQIIRLPDYEGYYTSLDAPTLNYGNMMRLGDLRLAQASLLVDQGQLVEGLQILQEEVDFYKKILSGQDNLIGPMIAIRQLLTIYHVVAEMLDNPELTGYIGDNTFKQLLTPLTTHQQQVIARSLAIERNSQLYFYYSLDDEAVNELGYFYDRNATANKAYKKFQTSIDSAMLTLPDVAITDTHITNKTTAEVDNMVSFLGYVIKEKGVYFLHNFAGEVLLSMGADNHYQDYQYRLYDLVSYLTLVNTKLAIRQASIEKQQIAYWLKAQNIINPYTQQAITWNEQQQLLTSEWLDNAKTRYINNKRDGEKPVIFINFKKD